MRTNLAIFILFFGIALVDAIFWIATRGSLLHGGSTGAGTMNRPELADPPGGQLPRRHRARCTRAVLNTSDGLSSTGILIVGVASAGPGRAPRHG